MPHRQEAITPGRGAVFEILVSVDTAEAQRLRASGQAIPQVSLRALIDSGADCTFIDTSHLPFLSQQRLSMQIVGGPSGSFTFSPQYEISLIIAHPSGNRRANLTRGIFPIVHISLAPFLGYEAIIGRDLLDDCLFWYNGPNQSSVLGW